jgi:hypothetical protein
MRDLPATTRRAIESQRDHGQSLYEEFCACPVGPHSPNLQLVLQVFRGLPVAGKHVLVALAPHRRWVLAELTGERGCPVILHPETEFTDLHEAERVIYRMRWKAITGEELPPG